jgi:predicted esterase
VLLLGCSACQKNEPSRQTGARSVEQPALAPSAAPGLPSADVSAAPGASAKPAPAPWPPKDAPDVETDWCVDAVRALDEDTCYVLPEAPSRELLIYLHGIVPPTPESTQKTNFEQVVANASRRAGVVAMIPRGEQGLAPKAFPRWWGWPSGASTDKRAAKFVEGFHAKRKKLEALIGSTFEHVYLAGSSQGAYFVASLALHGGFAASGYGAMSGGAGSRTQELAELPKTPFYIGYGKHDSVRGSARALGSVLEAADWPVMVAEHPVPHGAREIYLDEAFAFWRKHRL